MQDGKALQAGTSHFLGQNFARAFDVQFQSKEGKLEYAWATSWGVSTRLIGGLIMTHSDDAGLVLPPRIAPLHVVIVPIFKTDEERAKVLEIANRLATECRALPLHHWLNYQPVEVKIDDRDNLQSGAKFYEWEAKGIPIRVEIGPKDLAKNACVLARRDIVGKAGKEFGVPLDGAAKRIGDLLFEIQNVLYSRAKTYRDERTREVNSWDEFKAGIEAGGFLSAHWDGSPQTEEKIAEETKATIRCIPFDRKDEKGKCILSGQPSEGRVIFAQAY